MPVGFKWFVPGLLDGSVAFGGEESAGASFLRRDGRVWTTDKDGIILDLLAAEIIAVTGSTPSERYRSITERLGDPAYARIDAPATREQKAVLAKLSPDQFSAAELAGEPVLARLTDGARQRRAARRDQGRDRVRLVRRPAVRHRGRLQAVRRVVPRPWSPGPDPVRGAGAAGRRAGLASRKQIRRSFRRLWPGVALRGCGGGVPRGHRRRTTVDLEADLPGMPDEQSGTRLTGTTCRKPAQRR